MNRFRSLITVAAFSLAVLCLPAIASAQWGGYGNNGGYGGTGSYGNGQYGGYGNNGYYGDMRSIIRDLKDRSKDFQRQLDRDLDNSRYNGTYREDEMNRLAQDFRNAVGRLDSNGNNGRYNSNNDYRMQEVFNLASQIDRSIGRRGVSYNSQNIWQRIRYDLQQLNYNGGYNNNRNNRRNNGTWGNGNRNGLPSWWPF